eukprot:CAMPEP_0113383242 /NCGR_PEP_ID=MMETSP0013_2-20120614/6257_1 /TAXON_ID=2843 ORGANISM="Skeletonema costatum, Strain 1716" /NCGR_SAMPLE_ID=MMETSP0013_2 /ASSEMBLY_ACC=CAM_ASM_000158 /LENGTH=962 /DNA_ID=CAMNT_0000265775 /DNA_START=207 /DNA_END=3095 /DNA_ORIENTATION=- /assembly_acc=CAM_ASM_000158
MKIATRVPSWFTDDDPPSSSRRSNHHPRVLDHYSLPTPSSTVRFRSAHVHVYDSQGSQLILEERLTTRNTAQGKASSLSLHENGEQTNTTANVTVKRVMNSSPELLFLRGIYSAIAFFKGAFLFIFAVGLLLFLVSDLANQAKVIIFNGTGDNKDLAFPLIGTILSIPVFLHGLTQLMTLITSFVTDVFAGSPLLNSFGCGVVLTNWIKFTFFIGIPALTFVGLLLSGSQDFLPITLITTFVSVTFLFFCFSVNVVCLRVSSCLYLVKEIYEREDMTTTERLKYTILTAEESTLSGKVHKNYIYDSNVYDLKRLDSNSMIGGGNGKALYLYSSHGQWYIKFTQLMPRGLFTTLDLPMRCWTQAEIDFNIPFYTKSSWSLESVFCRRKNESHIAMVSGPSALTPKQSFSSLLCYFFGVVFYILLVTGLMVFAQVSATVIAAVVCLFVAYWLWQGRKEYRMIKHANTIIRRLQSDGNDNADGSDDNEDDYDSALFQKWETFMVTKPTLSFAWISFIVKNIIIAMIPLSYFCYSRNLVGAMTYLVLFLLCFEKHYFDIGPIVEALGSFGTLGMEPGLGAATRNEWQQKSRLYHITRMNNNASRRIWSKLLNFFAVLFGVVAMAAISSGPGQEEGVAPYVTFPSNSTFFYDVPQEEVSPMCNVNFGNNNGSNATSSLTSPVKYLADYNFLTIISYFKIDSIQPLLDTWFGEGEAFLDEDVIPTFREAHPDLPSAASFQLVSFSDGSAIVCVRGTTTYFDFLVDARLWYAASLFQLVQSAVPFGFAFDALIDFSVNRLSELEASSVKKVSYYVETTAFVNYLRKSGKYTTVSITGHSLGGGLALITGAQTQTLAIAISAPSAVMGRSAVTPEISLEDIKQRSYSVIPQRDIISHLGGEHMNSAGIKCRAGANDFFACHYAYRSLCELMYTCGNVKRPVYCECVSMGYPEPTSIDGSGTSLEFSCEVI